MKNLKKVIYRSFAVASACGLFVATSIGAEMPASESILQPEDIFALEYANDPQVHLMVEPLHMFAPVWIS